MTTKAPNTQPQTFPTLHERMNHPPFSISVVVPVHNEADFIPQGLPRLVDATRSAFPDAEILIVENGSTDGTADAVRARIHRRV